MEAVYWGFEVHHLIECSYIKKKSFILKVLKQSTANFTFNNEHLFDPVKFTVDCFKTS